MYGCYYLLVWCEDSACWWQADECEERSLGRAIALLRGRNPRTVPTRPPLGRGVAGRAWTKR